MIRRLLLVDDDAALRDILSLALGEEGFVVDIAATGPEALRRFGEAPPDLVILDVLLPEMDGLEVCRRLRRAAATPIVLLTSRGEEVDRVNGLEIGADDYVTKPFSTRELVARIRAIDRRLHRPQPGAEAPAPLRAGEMVVDPARFEARWRGDKVALTRAEFDLLVALLRNRGLVLSRERLLELARGEDLALTDRTIDTLVKRLRKKLREVDAAFAEIETVFGVGYRYRE